MSPMITPPTLDSVLKTMEVLGYAIFTGQPYDLNLIGIRTADRTSEAWNDWICLAYLIGDRWCWFPMPATTDPGLYWRQHPMNLKGTAILKEGQHRGAFKLGLHRGKEALVQARELTVYRDADRDEELDVGGEEETGWFGINLHRAAEAGPSTTVGKWSAGCQVPQDVIHYEFLLSLAKKAMQGWPTLTYTLLKEGELA